MAMQKTGSLQETRPDIAAEWHPTKNGKLLPTMVTVGSREVVWLICSICGHEWKTSLAERARRQGCPLCGFKRISRARHDISIVKNGTLQDKNPNLAAEWHPTRNGDKKPKDVTPNCGEKVWWLGACGHEWIAEIKGRNKGQNCPYCSNKKVLKGFNDLTTRNPKLAAEWHTRKNGEVTPETVLSGSNKKAWWLGECGHEWESVIASRNKGVGCPICHKEKRSMKRL